MSESQDIWVVIEHGEGVVKSASLEAVHAARMLAASCGGKITALVLDSGTSDSDLLKQVSRSGVDQVVHFSDPDFAHPISSRYLTALVNFISNGSPLAILLAATNHGKELASGLAASLGTGLATDCTSLEFQEGSGIRVERPVYAGKAISSVEFSGASPVIITLRPNAFRPQSTEEFPEASIIEQSVEWTDSSRLLEFVKMIKSSGALDITEARVVVSGGLGMQGSDQFSMLEELADVLGGAVGASRPVVDNGWREYSDQVGQTGRTVSPDLYIACGISGAVQHLAGMSSAKCVVAINKDANAPIFDIADYGIVGDALEIVPILTREFKSVV